MKSTIYPIDDYWKETFLDFIKHRKTVIVGIKVDKGRDVIKPVELATLLNEKFQSIFTTETLAMPDLLNRPSP